MNATPGTSVTSTTNELTIETSRHTAALIGEGVPALLRRAGIDRKQWDPRRRCWMVPLNRLWDVIAVAENVQKRTVHLIDVTR